VKKIQNYLLTHRIYLALILILAIGFFVRTYHFADWLHYEFDQSRDNIIVSEAIKRGPLSLPLLGPKADGTQLRVGPIYFYFEYISALVFGDTPQGHAYFVAILSLASILVFYLLLRKFFNQTISLGLVYLYSISFFMVLYSRFGWNPNILPFFVIAGIYSLLRATDKKSKYPGRWFILTAFLFCVATQLHFVAFFALPIFTTVFLVYERPRFSLKVWGASVLIFIVIYSPMVVSDIALDGFNLKEFIGALSTKTEHEDSYVIKIINTVRSGAENYAMILSGNDRIWTPDVKLEKGWISFSCKNYCKKTSPWVSYLSVVFFLLGAIILAWQLIKRKKAGVIMGLFFLATFFIFTKISTEPRFYLLVAPLPFFFLGSIVDLIWRKNALLAKIIFLSVIVLLSYTNISRIIQRFSDLDNADKKNIPVRSDRILKEPERVSLRQFEAVSQAMFDKYKENGYPVIFSSETLYFRSFMYLTEKLGAPVGSLEKGTGYQNANNFAIFRTRKAGGIKSYLEYYDISNKKEFGTITLFELVPKADKITAIDTPPLVNSFNFIRVPWQITWRDVLFK
jgi:4-amino-4-deoxy-L-arabinose transferase-like glycosyltransferase